jgi:hypothetical protein
MADRKISDLTALTTPASGDFLPIVDISEAAAASKNKRITIEELFRGVPLGTAAAPSIAIEGDEDTGVFSPGANQLAVATNGTERFRFGAAGQIGIGGATYGTAGQVLTSGGASAAPTWTSSSSSSDKISQGNTEAEVVDTGSDGHFKVTTEGSERLRVDPSGRLGIGSSTALAYKLNIYESGTGMINALHLGSGGGIAGNGTSISFGLGTGFDPTANILAKIGGIYTGGGYDGALTFSTCSNTSQGVNPPERMRITSAGNVGIGTASPVDALHVLSSGGNTRIDTSTNAGTASLLFDVPASNGLRASGHRARISCQHEGAGWDSSLVFYAGNTSTTPSEAMRIDASRRLLVGTSTARSNFFNGPDTAGFQLEGTGATNRFSAQIYGNGSVTGPYQIFAKHGGIAVGSTTLVSSGDEIGGLSFQGSDGTEFVEGARITAYVDGTPGANDRQDARRRGRVPRQNACASIPAAGSWWVRLRLLRRMYLQARLIAAILFKSCKMAGLL